MFRRRTLSPWLQVNKVFADLARRDPTVEISAVSAAVAAALADQQAQLDQYPCTCAAGTFDPDCPRDRTFQQQKWRH